MPEWFETWFDSEYYHMLYAHRDHEEAERFMRNLSQKLALPPGSSILDAACGKGRHSKFLESLGYEVTGIDLSENSITQAQQMSNDHLTFEIADLRQFDLGRSFDCICNLFTSFGYFDNPDDNLKVLRQFHQHLKPSGLLVIDYLNESRVRSTLKSEEHVERGGVGFNIIRRIEHGKIIKDIEVEVNGGMAFSEQVSAFSLVDFKEMFSRTGFSLINTFGGYDLEPFDHENSNRLILLAQPES